MGTWTPIDFKYRLSSSLHVQSSENLCPSNFSLRFQTNTFRKAKQRSQTLDWILRLVRPCELCRSSTSKTELGHIVTGNMSAAWIVENQIMSNEVRRERIWLAASFS